MSTHSRIGIKNSDGSVTAVYCHCDGYPEYNGRILCEHYGTEEKAKALIALGSLSSIRPRLATDDGEFHTFSDAKGDITIAYHRDRGEDFKQEYYPNTHEFHSGSRDYRYLFSNGIWFLNGDEANTWVPLELK